MSDLKVYMGIHQGEKVWLTKHQWDCGWYWGFGYLGNRNWHWHFDSIFNMQNYADVTKIFEKSPISQEKWWIVLDLFKQAYTLKTAAEVYRRGGGISGKSDCSTLIKDLELVDRINKDLETVLDALWAVLTTGEKS